MQEVGQRLSKAHIYLQHPTLFDKVTYSNPHYFVLPGRDQEQDWNCYLEQKTRKPEAMDMDGLFEGLDHTEGLQVCNAGGQICTSLLE